MADLLIIADDFTGALDTGIQFAKKGIKTRVIADTDYNFLNNKMQEQVLVIDTETRHVTPRIAYRIVEKITRNAVKAGIPRIYKKTDSALRGNIGSELKAVMDGSKQKKLYFIPAFPAMKRTTVNGIQYVNNKPVAESVFGKDPYEPVKESRVSDIIARQVNIGIYNHLVGEKGQEAGIHVYDASTEEDIKETAQKLKKMQELRLLAGCAGFASVLSDVLELTKSDVSPVFLPTALFVVCGSVNPITQAQLNDAEEAGFTRIMLSPRQKVSLNWVNSYECEKYMDEWEKDLKMNQHLILDANDLNEGDTKKYAEKVGLTQEELRVRVAANMGRLLKKMLDREIQATLFITGGDTLMAFMREAGARDLIPLGEICPGAVLSKTLYQGREYYIISKSGGFGNQTLISGLAQKIYEEDNLLC